MKYIEIKARVLSEALLLCALTDEAIDAYTAITSDNARNMYPKSENELIDLPCF